MTDWNNPSTSQTHSNELAATKGRDESVAVMDFSSDSNIPDGTIRWNATAQRFEIWDATGASWSELVSKYLINVDQLDGRDAGNASGDVPISNGTVNTNLNADQLDGEHGAFYDDAPNGTVMVFYQAAAPTGWTQDTSVNDRVLQVTSGSGGGTGGSWTITGLSSGQGTLAVGAGTLSVDGHILTEAEMPSHNHGGSTGTAGSHSHSRLNDASGNNDPLAHDDTGAGVAARIVGLGSGTDVASADMLETNSAGNHSHSIPTEGSDSAHNHGLSGSPDLSGSPSVSHDGSWRPSRIDVIVATRSK